MADKTHLIVKYVKNTCYLPIMPKWGWLQKPSDIQKEKDRKNQSNLVAHQISVNQVIH